MMRHSWVHERVQQALGDALEGIGCDRAVKVTKHYDRAAITITHIESGFHVEAEDSPESVLAAAKQLAHHLSRHLREARDVYQDPHIVRL